MNSKLPFACAILLQIIICVRSARRPSEDEYCPLCDYVFFDDGYYNYTYLGVYNRSEDLGLPVTTYMMNVTSQKWKDESWTDKPIWWHYLAINVPDQIVYTENSFLYIDGSNNEETPPDINREHIVRTAEVSADLKIVTGNVYNIPNQPLIYTDDPRQKPRREDDSIGWTWRYFMDQEAENPPADPEVVLRMPMCKGAVRAMDTIQNVVNIDLKLANVSKFFMVGQSKRGWTTWMTAAIDDRVVAMAPSVLTCLNMHENFHHYWRSFDGWPLYFWDYWSKDILGRIDSPEFFALQDLVDPFSYRQWMNFPKLIIAGVSDEFFLLDDSHYFFDDLPGEKYMWLMENSGHNIEDSPSGLDFWAVMRNFYLAVIENYQRPVFNWIINSAEERNGTATITVFTDQVPSAVVAYSAPTVVPERRDWRLKIRCDVVDEVCGEKETNITWIAKEVEDIGAGQYQVEYEAPEEGFLAAFIKLEFPTQDENRKFIFTTEVAVLPNYFPYPDCEGRNCTGILK